MSLLRPVALAFGATGVGGFSFYKLNPDSPYSRSMKLWTQLGPVIAHYRWLELKQKMSPLDEVASDKAYGELHVKYANHVMEVLRDLRGFYIKVAQVMANRSDMLPDLYIESLRTLEDQVPATFDGPSVRAFICNSLKLERLEDAFENFVDKPLGSASIGQVHKAHLKNGEAVAIKVQAPGAEDLFRHDIGTSKNFCRVFAPEQVAIFDEIEKQFLTEFDYREEAIHLDTVASNMKQFPNVVVPRPIMKHCSKEVLTMQFLNGIKLVDGIRANGAEYASMNGKSLRELELEMKRDFDKNGLPPIYSGPSAATLGLYRTAVSLRDKIVNAPIILCNYSLSALNWAIGTKYQIPYVKSFIPLNSSFIMNTLLECHGHQLFMNGYFNADSHPGNFLLMDDGHIGLIDYGQVKKLESKERILLAKAVVAIASGEPEKIVQSMLDCGYSSKSLDPEVIHKVAIILLDQDGRGVTEGLNLQQYLDKLYKIDPWDKAADYMVMPIRLSLLLRGTGLMLNHPVSVCRSWRPIAEKYLREQGVKI